MTSSCHLHCSLYHIKTNDVVLSLTLIPISYKDKWRRLVTYIDHYMISRQMTSSCHLHCSLYHIKTNDVVLSLTLITIWYKDKWRRLVTYIDPYIIERQMTSSSLSLTLILSLISLYIKTNDVVLSLTLFPISYKDKWRRLVTYIDPYII